MTIRYKRRLKSLLTDDRAIIKTYIRESVVFDTYKENGDYFVRGFKKGYINLKNRVTGCIEEYEFSYFIAPLVKFDIYYGDRLVASCDEFHIKYNKFGKNQ